MNLVKSIFITACFVFAGATVLATSFLLPATASLDRLAASKATVQENGQANILVAHAQQPKAVAAKKVSITAAAPELQEPTLLIKEITALTFAERPSARAARGRYGRR